jgi:prepilin signal peptidase PulO-like enzyme (type II secretory pathway)
MGALLCAVLSAIACADARFGIIPDALTLVPLAVVVAAGATQGHYGVALSAALAFVPFAIAATLSKGYGMGWGDAKLAALGGAVLGAQTAVFVFAFACLAAGAVAYARGGRRTPIAFGPYLAAAIVITMPLAGLQ